MLLLTPFCVVTKLDKETQGSKDLRLGKARLEVETGSLGAIGEGLGPKPQVLTVK